MGNVATITTPLAQLLEKQVTKHEGPVSAWDAATSSKRSAVLEKVTLASYVLNAIEEGAFKSVSGAVDGLLRLAKSSPADYPQLYRLKSAKLPSRASLIGWVTKYREGGAEALLSKRIGSKPKQYDWEARALTLYAHCATSANRPDAGTVAYQLCNEGFGKIKPATVRTVLNRYAKSQTDFSRKRVGAHYHTQNIGRHVIRDTTNLPVGYCYMGDGHMCDVYVAHPANGGSWRPEITVWVDWRSNYIVDWFISNAESAVTTLHSLAKMFDKHRHIPARLYVDPGSGFKNKIITEGADSFCERYDISAKFALPGNAKGKGLVEGWFHWFEFRCGKTFETYCGHERTDNALSNMQAKIKRGDIKLPSLEEYKTEIQRYVDWYNDNPQKDLGCAPSELWQTLERIDPVHSHEQMIRPTFEVTVRRCMFTFKKRKYTAPLLIHFTGQKVKIEVDIHNDATVTVRDSKGKYICEASLVERKHAVAPSIVQEEQRQRLEGQIKRLEVHKQDAIGKSRRIVDTRTIDAAACLTVPSDQIEPSPKALTNSSSNTINPEDLHFVPE